MNRKEIITMLLKLFEQFQNDIYFHPSLLKEILALLNKSGYESDFFRILVVRLQALADLGIDVYTQKEFENIGGGLFSMHLTGKGFNLRILFAFQPDKTPALLTCFNERQGKRVSSYDPYIRIANQRLKEVLNDEKQ